MAGKVQVFRSAANVLLSEYVTLEQDPTRLFTRIRQRHLRTQEVIERIYNLHKRQIEFSK